MFVLLQMVASFAKFMFSCALTVCQLMKIKHYIRLDYIFAKQDFYCVNTSYPMDNSLSGRRRPARQTSEKDVLCRHRPAGPQYCALPRWRLVLPSCLDNLTSLHLFRLARVLCRHVFSTSPDILSKSVPYDGFSTPFVDIFSVEVLSTDQARIYF